jgi:Fic family protein
VLKNALDVDSRAYGKSVWRGKPGAIVSVSPGAIGGFGAHHHLRRVLAFLSIPAMAQPEAYVGGAGDLFDGEGAIAKEATRQFMTSFMAAFEAWIGTVRGCTRLAPPPRFARSWWCPEADDCEAGPPSRLHNEFSLVSSPVIYHLGEFPPRSLDWARLIPLLGKASAALARYDGMVAAMTNAAVLLSPLTTQEAVLSSKIEGTNVTMAEVLEIEAGANEDFDEPKRDDAEEIRNYRLALNFAAQAVRERGLTPHLLREAHAMLMNGVRGRDKDPGSFRTEQNWIGKTGCQIEEAAFVPIPQPHLSAGLEAWGRYVVSAEEPDPLVQLAIVHAEFEALHPFKDGNGRLGRMLIPLFLHPRGILGGPSFYVSGYLERRRDEYIERLRAISRDGDWTGWVGFFLQGLIEQAAENQQKAGSILELHQRMQRRVAELTHSQFAPRAVGFMFDRPVFSSSHFAERANIPRESALRILRVLREAQVLIALREGAGRRATVFAFSELLNIAEGRTFL